MKNTLTFYTLCGVVLIFLSSFLNENSGKKEIEITSLILVRHAEKNNETDTTTLTPAGYDRANRLSRFLNLTNLSAIYSTPFVRMHLTAKPTAVAKQIPIQDYTPREISEIDKMILTNYGKTILVIGHGNSIPAILNHYTGSSMENLTGYNDVFVLNIINQKANTNSFIHFYY